MTPVYISILLSIFLAQLGLLSQYDGVLNDSSIDPNFNKGHEAITASITENLAHLNLFEYAHALPELYPLIENGIIKQQEWKQFIDSLELAVRAHQNDTIRPYWAVDYLGIIPLQAKFFVSTLDKNDKLNRQYPNAYRILKQNTSTMEGLEYTPEQFDSLLVFSEVVGETNFWYFFQLEDCKLVRHVIQKNEKLVSRFKAITSSLDIASTYKVPFYLQKRKWQALRRRLMKNTHPLCQQAFKNMEHISIAIMDEDKEYFKMYEKENLDYNKMKEF